MEKSHNFLDFNGQHKRFLDYHKKVNGKFNGESENRDTETLGSILRALGSKYHKKGQNFKVIIS